MKLKRLVVYLNSNKMKEHTGLMFLAIAAFLKGIAEFIYPRYNITLTILWGGTFLAVSVLYFLFIFGNHTNKEKYSILTVTNILSFLIWILYIMRMNDIMELEEHVTIFCLPGFSLVYTAIGVAGLWKNK